MPASTPRSAPPLVARTARVRTITRQSPRSSTSWSALCRVLVGDEVIDVGEGDLAVVPPGVTHAFAAAPGWDAELVVAAIPGVERFELFRRFERVCAGLEPPDALADQSRYDTYADTSRIWEQARDTSTPAPSTTSHP